MSQDLFCCTPHKAGKRNRSGLSHQSSSITKVVFYTVPPLLSGVKAYLSRTEHFGKDKKVSKDEVGRATKQVEKNITGRMNNKNIRILLERLEAFPAFPKEMIPEFDLTDDDPYSPLTSLADDKEKKPGEPSLFWSVLRQLLWPLVFYFCKLF